MPKVIAFGDIVEENGKTILQNNMEKTHSISMGALVEVKYDEWYRDGACAKIHARLWVTHLGRDCDGTPLYWLAREPKPWEGYDWAPEMLVGPLLGQVGGFTEDQLTVIEVSEDVKKGEGALQWEDQ